MAHIPERVRDQSIIKGMEDYLISQGKVGDKYRYPGRDDLIVSVRSDRLSVFDFVLPLIVPQKGAVLTAATDLWERQILQELGVNHHLEYSQYYPGRNMAKELKDRFPAIDLTRTLVTKKAQILPYEFIFRQHPGGSVWKQYLKNGTVAGVQLPQGLKQWQALEEPLFTPSTKAEEGHDINMTVQEFTAQAGGDGTHALITLSVIYKTAYAYARARGITLLDTKFEVGMVNNVLTLCDEWLTPDSSRFVDSDDLEASLAANKDPSFMDKQPVRDFCAQIKTPFKGDDGEWIVGFKDLDPENQDHLQFVANYDFPEYIAANTTTRFLQIFSKLSDYSLLLDYQNKYLL